MSKNTTGICPFFLQCSCIFLSRDLKPLKTKFCDKKFKNSYCAMLYLLPPLLLTITRPLQQFISAALYTCALLLLLHIVRQTLSHYFRESFIQKKYTQCVHHGAVADFPTLTYMYFFGKRTGSSRGSATVGRY